MKHIKKRLTMLHGYIEPSIKQINRTATKKKTHIEPKVENSNVTDDFSIVELVTSAKANSSDIVTLLKEYIVVDEVKV